MKYALKSLFDRTVYKNMSLNRLS